MDTCWFLVIFGMLLIELDLTDNSANSKRLIPPFQVHNDNTHFSLSLSLSLLQKLSPHVCVCMHLCVMYVCMHVYKHLCTCVQRS